MAKMFITWYLEETIKDVYVDFRINVTDDYKLKLLFLWVCNFGEERKDK